MATIQAMPIPEKITNEGDVDVEFDVIRMAFGEGYEQIAPNGLNYAREIRTVIWAPLTPTEATTVWNTLLTVGSHGILTWTPCDAVTQKKYRLAENKITKSFLGNNFKISIKVKEAFDLS